MSLQAESKTFDFLNEDEVVYTKEDLKEEAFEIIRN